MGIIAALWGIIGITLILGSAMFRLWHYGIDAFSYTLTWYHWLVAIVWTAFMAVGEGYRGFQKGFSPRVAARIAYLHKNPTPLRLIFAPFFCMGYFDINRKRQIITFCITLSIIVLIMIVHHFTQPWRGLIDIGVITGLAWGLISLYCFVFQAFTNENFAHSPQMPEASAR